MTKLGQHQRIELPSGRRAGLYPGEEIIVCYGARYAPDQFEAFVPDHLGTCHLVAAGGIAAEYSEKHNKVRPPTQIQPIGLLIDTEGKRLNLADHALPERPMPARTPPLIAVTGTMMNAGKTTCAANLMRGLKRRGLRVGVAKITGTGAGGDRWKMVDAGADLVLDFTDVGVSSTAGLTPERLDSVFCQLVAHLAASAVDVIVVEVADGLFQRETAMLLDSESFRLTCNGIVFAASDAMGAMAGVQYLNQRSHRVLAVGGTLSASPLATRETRMVVPVPVVTSAHLETGWWMPFPEPAPRPTELGRSIVELPARSENLDRRGAVMVANSGACSAQENV